MSYIIFHHDIEVAEFSLLDDVYEYVVASGLKDSVFVVNNLTGEIVLAM
jgi:hypothetical protein